MEYQKLLQRAQREKEKIPNYIDELVNDYDFNTLIRNRWLKGKRPNGEIIGRYKNGGGLVDLTDTTEMGKQIQIFEVRKNVYAFGSGVDYYDKIVEMFGLDNFNITPKETIELFDFIMLKVQEKYLNNVYLI